MAARSFNITAATAEDLARTLADARGHVPSPAGGVVFVSGALSQQVARVAAQVRVTWRGVPTCVVPAAGVISERGELEGASAASGILWSGGSVEPVAVTDPQGKPASAVSELLAKASGGRAAAAVLFARPESLGPELLDTLAAAAPNLCVFGAGTVGGVAAVVTSSGEVMAGPIAGLVIRGLAMPLVEATPGCRLLGPMERIDEASGGLVFRVGGRPALDVLSSLTPEVGQGGTQPLVLAALSEEEPGDQARFVLRTVRGVDPTRRAVMVGREARPGMWLTFAAREAPAARAGLEAAARKVAQSALGAAPRFALFLSCAGRGQGLYGAQDVESRMLRQRFGELPIAGMHSSFEIVPWGPGTAKLTLYTGVLALFRSPS